MGCPFYTIYKRITINTCYKVGKQHYRRHKHYNQVYLHVTQLSSFLYPSLIRNQSKNIVRDSTKTHNGPGRGLRIEFVTGT